MAFPGDLATLQWRFPAALALVLVPLLWALWTRRRERQVLAYADEALRPWAIASAGGRGRPRGRTLLLGLAWGLLGVALAGPRWPVPTAADAPAAGASARHAVDVVVVLDQSASMRETDVAPDRATRARLELADLLRRLRGERLGLVLLTAEPGLALPLTRDLAVFEDMLRVVSTDPAAPPAIRGGVGQGGGDLAGALRVAGQALQGSPAGSGAVLLVTDAEAGDLDGAPGEAARAGLAALAAARVPVFVWAMSDARTAGDAPARRPDHATWALAVRPTGGDLVPVQAGDGDLDAVVDAGLGRLPGVPVDPAAARGWQEAYRAPLAAGLLLWMLAGWPGGRPRPRRTAARAPPTIAAVALGAAVAVAVTLLPAEVAAGPTALAPAGADDLERQAWAAWQARRWARAEGLYGQLGTAPGALAASAAALRAGDGPAARRRASQALWLATDAGGRLDALHNLGHAHALHGRWDVAAEAWAAVLAGRPADARAAANLAVAQAELARRARRAGAASDLRGRRGFTLEGLVSTEGEGGREPPALAEVEGRRDGRAAAGDARLAAAAGVDGAAFEPGARHLASGLTKLPQLVDARAALVRGLVRQDRDGGPALERPPW
jgi:Ca-activated chloride channel family protein